jgi:tetratricopeptide (TPR) repeat protein
MTSGNDTLDLPSLQRRALELMKLADFGDESISVNSAIVQRLPKDDSAWTRLGRCYLEQRQFDEAVTALRTALSINPSKTVATNLLAEVRKQRALTPTATERASTGFSTREFALIESLSGDELVQALRPRMEALFDTLNASTVAGRIVEARRRQGEIGSKLFHTNSYQAGAASAHVSAFHHGGRWEPQFNLGWLTEPKTPSCLRIGLGFNFLDPGRDPDRASNRDQVLRYFEHFQQVLARSWQRELARWMANNSGFLQYGENAPALDLLPEQALEWVVSCRNAAAVGWIFVGRWLFLHRADDARLLSDRAKLATVVDDTFRALLPIWLSTYGEPTATSS